MKLRSQERQITTMEADFVSKVTNSHSSDLLLCSEHFSDIVARVKDIADVMSDYPLRITIWKYRTKTKNPWDGPLFS